MLNARYIAQRFFGKSRYWISQQLNHNVKNGKETGFNESEYKQLKKAIETIALELQALADSMLFLCIIHLLHTYLLRGQSFFDWLRFFRVCLNKQSYGYKWEFVNG